MNILFMEAGESGHGGSFVSLLQMLTLLSVQGHQLTVILWNSSPFIEQYEALGAHVIRVDNPIYTTTHNKFKYIYNKLMGVSRRIFPSLCVYIELLLQHSCYRQVIKIARDNHIELIHLNNQPIRNFIGFWVAKRLKLPLISHLRTLHSFGFTHSHVRFMEKLNYKALAVSGAVKQCWEKAGISVKRISVLHNPYDGSVKRQPLSAQSPPKKIVYVGRLEPGKGLDFLLESFAVALRSIPDLTLTIIGTGSLYEYLFELGKQLKLDRNLNFLGYIKDAKQHLSEFDILILPSQNEGFGRVVIEAMAHGVCAIATHVGGITEIIENKVNGLLVDYGDTAALSDAIVMAVNDDSLRQEMIKQAYNTVETQFNEENFYHALVAEYQSFKHHQGYDLAIVISDLGSGGTQRVVSQLINYWSRHDKSIAVLTLSTEETDFFRLPTTVDRYVVGGVGDSKNKFLGLLANIKRIKKLRKQLTNIKPKKILSFLCATNILTILAAHKLNIPLIISERNDPARQSFGVAWDLLRRKLYRRADRVTANTQTAIETLSDFVPRNKLKWIQNPIAELVVDTSVAFENPTILAVGRLHHQKAYDVLLQAFAKFHQHHSHWRLAIIGEGDLREQLQRQAKYLGIVPYIKWYGRVNNPFPYYFASQIFVMHSRHEGMPNALLEAMSCDLPVIISDALPGPLEYVQNNISGLVVPVESVDALANALSRLASDEHLREQLAAAASERLSNHSIEEVVGTWNSILG
ncbi:glycosyltransferase [Candidiatus Paracoxiella cheracis]|uniref:glycosyltransferase n=1 Tax=Candidiatus Paracoxiella cheracis TaxID=3405120 RepID=UPI003BF513E9